MAEHAAAAQAQADPAAVATPAASSDVADPSAESAPPFDYESVIAPLRSIPRDVAARLLEEVEPLKAERDTHAQRAQAKRDEKLRKEWEAEREAQAKREAELETLRAQRQRQFDLARKAEEGDYDAREELLGEVLPLFKREQLKEDPELRAHFREALKDDDDLAAYHRTQAMQGIFGSLRAHPVLSALSDEQWRGVLDTPDPVAFVDALFGVYGADKVPAKEVDALVEAARLEERDKQRAGQPTPDRGRNAVPASPGRLTRAAIAQMTQQERIANLDAIRAQWGDLAHARE